MAEFKKLSEVEKIESASDNASVLIEDDGEIKRVPKSEVGGRGGNVAVITTSSYDNYISGISTVAGDGNEDNNITYSCKNMTFDEAKQALLSGELLDVKVYHAGSVASIFASGTVAGIGGVIYSAAYDADADVIVIIGAMLLGGMLEFALYWTADGISEEAPSADN